MASQTGIVSLGMLWWSNVFNTGVRNVAAAEIQRQADFLTSAWDAKNSELLIGVGDSINDTTNQLDMYSDFGSADRALAIGPQPDTDPFGPLVRPPQSPPHRCLMLPTAPAARSTALRLSVRHVAQIELRTWAIADAYLFYESHTPACSCPSRPSARTRTKKMVRQRSLRTRPQPSRSLLLRSPSSPPEQSTKTTSTPQRACSSTRKSLRRSTPRPTN